MVAYSVLQICIIVCAVYVTSVSSCFLQTPSYRNFSTDTSLNVINPARGFYRTLITSSIPAIFQPIQSNILNCWRERDGIILLMRKYSFDDYVDGRPLSNTFLSNLRYDLQIIRDAGWNVVMRFMYSHRIGSTYNVHDEPSAVNISTHIQQLSLVINDFEGVIIAVQAGFHGEFGLWYDPGISYTETDQEIILHALLNYISSAIVIQVPGPKYKWLVVGNQKPTTFSESKPPLSPLSSARIGHYHECLIGGHHASSLENAFPDLDSDVAAFDYLKADTHVTLMGGKACHPGNVNSNSQDICIASEGRFHDIHLTYLDLEDPQEMILTYKQHGCFEKIQRNLGYSFVKTSAQLPDTVYANSDFCMTVNFEIKGYAYPPSDLKYFIVFKKKNSSGSVEYFRSSVSNLFSMYGSYQVRKISMPLSVRLNSLAAGQYEVLVAFFHKSLEAYPDYYVLFSNEKYPFHEFGLNRLENITILPNANTNTHLTGLQLTRWYPPRAPFHTRIRNPESSSCSSAMPTQTSTTNKPPTTRSLTTTPTTHLPIQSATKLPLSSPFVAFPANPKVFQTCNKRNLVSALVKVNRYYHSTSAFCADMTRTPPDVIPKIFCQADDSITWSPAGRVIDNCDQVQLYTPVAVFQDKFGSIAYDSTNNLSGVFLGCIKDGPVVKGIKIAVQFCGRSFDVVNILLNRNFETLDKLYIITWT